MSKLIVKILATFTCLLLIYGYFANIYKLLANMSTIGLEETLVRIAGIPLFFIGCVAGFF